MRVIIYLRAIVNMALATLLVIMGVEQLAQIHLFECFTLLGLAMALVNQELHRLEYYR